MEWISVKDRLPNDYDADYVVLVTNIQPDENGIIPTWLRLNVKAYELHIAKWDEADLTLVKFYQDRGDHSWDWAGKDHFCECDVDVDKITHWLKIPKYPTL